MLRIDASGSLGKAQRTPQGGYQIPATLTRSGVFTYVEAGRTVREWRPPEEVEASIVTLTAATPVTHLHPVDRGQNVYVTPQNYRKFAVGNLVESARMDGADGHVSAVLALQDAGIIAAVEAGAREISCGYSLERVDETPGVTPDGEEYDRIQRGIKYNHVAIVPRGRAGNTVALRLDGAGNSIPEGQPTMKFRVDGRDVAAEDLPTAIAQYEVKQTTAIQTLTSERDAALGRADTAEASVKDLESKVAELADPKRVDEAVSARLALVADAQKVLGPDWRADGQDELAIKRAVAKHSHPALAARIDSATVEYLTPLFDAALTRSAADPERLDSLRGVRTTETVDVTTSDTARLDSADDIRAREIAESRAAGLPKLAYSKD